MKISTAFVFLSLALLCTPAVYAEPFGSGANTFNIEFVTIGNPGNTADTTGDPNPAGSVAEEYRIGKFEISRDMIIKANAVGGIGITLADMTHLGGNEADRPATGVSWFEAAQFVNWLNTSTGATPAYKFDGGGNFQLWTSADAGFNPANLYRNSLATYFLPSVDEWYKAAYYDPIAGIYYNYPTGSDSVPDGIDFAGDTTFDAVFFDGGFNLRPNNITDVGLLSPYGTAGQGGNVFEWEETDYDLVNDSISTILGVRGVRGGNWSFNSSDLAASDRFGNNPSLGDFIVGFRVASIPEPSSLLLGVLGAMGLLLWRKVWR